MNDNITKIGGAILIGGLVGAAIALLCAPKSVYRTRRDIIRKARNVKNSATDLIEDTIDDVHDIIKYLRGKVNVLTLPFLLCLYPRKFVQSASSACYCPGLISGCILRFADD